MVTIFIVVAIHFSLYLYGNKLDADSGRLTGWTDYIKSNQLLVGILLYLWIIGFNIVSFVIYRQFEQSEVLPADDFYICTWERSGREPLVIRLPDHSIAIGMESDTGSCPPQKK